MKIVTVVAAIIYNDDKILCVQRPKNKYSYISEKFEFPGGKIEEGETEVEALKREIQEELSLEIQIENKFLIVEHDYPDFRLIMHSYTCMVDSKDVILHEHIDLKWLSREELDILDWAAADVPIVNKIMS
jgi:8-oxo-dGTP diphosphatase